MKTILVPVDYSAPSENALVYAFHLAKILEARIVLFHAFDLPLAVPLPYQDMVEDLKREEMKSLHRFLELTRQKSAEEFVQKFHTTFGTDPEVAPPFPQTKSGFHTIEEETEPQNLYEVQVECVAEPGEVQDQIFKAVEACGARLIVMAIRENVPLGQAYIGSTFLDVVEKSNVPVLAVTSGKAFKSIQTIVFASDLLHMPHYSNLNTLHDFIKETGAELLVLHLYNQKPEDEKPEAVSALVKLDVYFYDLNFKIYFQHKPDIAAGILDFVKKHKADLLVLVPHKHNFLELLLARSITGKMVTHLKIPLLALPSSY